MRRSVIHILGFFAVGFVLAFLGRINKTDLYHTFFRTIQDVEIRNSQALSNQDIPTLQDFTMEDIRSRIGNWLSFLGSFLDLGVRLEVPQPSLVQAPLPETKLALRDPFHFLSNGLPNAPPCA